MNRYLYYPGCTLKTQAKNFEDSAIASARALGIELVEMERWNCCGTVFSLASDNLIQQLAPIRDLLRVKEMGGEKVVTLCAMCYNTLKRANELLRGDGEKREKIQLFMDREEIDYGGEVEVLHFLELLRDEVGWKKIAKKVKNPLPHLKVASYYGCLLLRPEEVAIDDPEAPTILSDLLSACGCETVDFPYRTECCGAYQTVDQAEVVAERTFRILTSARKSGAEAVVTSCPLCFFNLDARQKEAKAKYPDFIELPVFYFTQILALALGLEKEIGDLELHHIDPLPALEIR